MVKELTQHQLEIITDLYHAVDGQAGSFVAADAVHHSPLYWLAHECRALITIRKEKHQRKTYRTIALTENGVLWCESNGIYAREPLAEAYVPKADARIRKTIAFQLPEGDRAVGLIETCKSNRDFVPVIRLAMELYTAIGIKGFKQLVVNHADEIKALQIAHDEIASERQRIALEHAALEAQTLEVKQFHDIFRDISTKLDSLQNTATPANSPEMRGLQPVQGSTQGNAPKTLNVPQFAAPVYDDEDDEDLLSVQADAGAGKRANENFLNSIMALNE